MGNTLKGWSDYNPILVSVICTCYNHGKYVKNSLDSLVQQSHENTEIVIIDNGSKDNSPDIIRQWMEANWFKRKCKTIFHSETINYCKSFNQGLSLVRGKYTIDLSADDVLLSNHLATAVETLEASDAAVYFSNAYLEGGKHQPGDTFYPIDNKGNLKAEVVSGDIYVQVIQKNHLCAPTLVFKTELLKLEGGYDEALSYEDFDIIVRMARKYPFVFHENIGVKKRLLNSSFSSAQYRARESVMLPSTLKVCRKIREMNKSREENRALQIRLMHETKHALASANFAVAVGLLALANETGLTGLRYRLFWLWAWSRLDFSLFYRLFSRGSINFSRFKGRRRLKKSKLVHKFG